MSYANYVSKFYKIVIDIGTFIVVEWNIASSMTAQNKIETSSFAI